MAAAMAVPLDPELTAILAPSAGCEPWRLEYCLRRGPGVKQLPAFLPSAEAARELFGPHVTTGRDFSNLIESLTALL